VGRIRTIKPEFHSHEELSGLPAETHLFAGALVNYADDEGYFNANPVLVKAGTNPLRSDKTSLEHQLEQLVAIGYLEIRRSGLKHYGRICNFDEHQRVSHKTLSKIKDRFDSLPKSSGEPPEDRTKPSALKGIELNGIEQGTGNREASTAGAVSASKPFLTFYLTGNKTHIVTEADIQSWEQAYPGVDVRQELRKVMVWLDANPTKRSASRDGMKQRIVKWLGRTQDQGGSRGTNQSNRNYSKTGGNVDAGRGAIAILEQAERDSQAADEVLSEAGGGSESGDLSHLRAGSIDLRN
jgi:hypothetical protein